jgi:hypothetical protein
MTTYLTWNASEHGEGRPTDVNQYCAFEARRPADAARLAAGPRRVDASKYPYSVDIGVVRAVDITENPFKDGRIYLVRFARTVQKVEVRKP